MVPRLYERYKKEMIPEMQKKFGIKNPMAVPRLTKIVVNMGVGEAITDMKMMDTAMNELALIAGQRPALRRAKLAISNFKIKKGMPIGCKVTLRRGKMYEFLDRLVNFCLPRIRDFNGIPTKSFDAQGNFSLGISDQAIFPEIDSGRIQRTQGMNVTFVFNQGTQEQNRELLRLFGMPFRKN